MNRIHPSTPNNRAGAPAAANERPRTALKALVAALMLAFGPQAFALPTGGAVSAGTAGIAAGAGTLTVNQSSQNVAINWQGFSIAQGEAVRFVQPNSSAVALNRVLGADPSSILGSLSANGKVFLVNPNGILFGRGAQVNVGGLVASTLNISDGDFMAGRYRFAGSGTGSVLNQGSIIAQGGGYVALLGAKVSNEGMISASLGTVALAAGEAMTLDMAGDGLLNVTVDRGAIDALVDNGGVLRAPGGQVLMSADAAGHLLKTVVNNTGIVEAQNFESHNGTIRLLGGQNGTVMVGGTLDASGMGAGQSGGRVTVTGRQVGMSGGHINASGDAGGGTVLIGGDFQGKNASVQNAAATYMSADSIITADAITEGNGGKVVLWADGSTRAYGRIASRGGAQGGDGGLIETSGHWLDVAGIDVSAGAPNGKGGTWLLDPADVTIGAGTVGGAFVGGVFSPDSGNAVATVDAGTIQATLNGGTDVTITTANTGVSGAGVGDITVASALTWTTGKTLTLNAQHDVIVNMAMTASTQNSKMVLTAGNDVKVNAALVASAQGSQILLTAGNDVLATAAVTATGLNALIDIRAGQNVSVVALTADGGGLVDSVNLRANKDVIVNGTISAAGGSVVLRADSDGSGPGVLGGTVRFVNPGNVGASTTTAIRFNPDGYTNTAAEIAAYVPKVTAVTRDTKAWVFPEGIDRPYNGLTAATLRFKNPLPADNPHVGNTVTLDGGAATFDSKDVGVLKTVTFNGFTVGGGDQARFALFSLPGVAAGNGTTTASITAIPLTVTANDHAAKIYGSTVTFAGTEFTSSGLVNSEAIGSVSLASAGAAPAAAVALYAITPSSATANGAFAPSNYTITYVDGTLPVTPAPLVITANGATKPFGTTLTFAGTEFTHSALQNGDTVGTVSLVSPGTPPGASVAGSPYAITPSSPTGGTFTPSNYTLSFIDGALRVMPLIQPEPVVAPPVVAIPVEVVAPPIVVDAAPIVVDAAPIVVDAAPIVVDAAPIVVVDATPPDLPTGTSPTATSPATTSSGSTSPDVADTAASAPLIRNAIGSRAGLAGLNLSVLGGGLRMPPVQLAQVPPVRAPAAAMTPAAAPLPAAAPVQVAAPVQSAPPAAPRAVPLEKIVVPAVRPMLPPKRDRN